MRQDVRDVASTHDSLANNIQAVVYMVRDLVFGDIIESACLGISVVLGIDRLAQDILADIIVKAM